MANQSKTTLLILNCKKEDEIKIDIGGSMVKQVHDAKLLGVQINDKQKWNTQIGGTGVTDTDPSSTEMDKLQIAHNNMLRTLEHVQVKDKSSI